MLKKPGLEELVRELERDYARWEQVYMAGSKDPFWPDGVNANLCRNHILCGKDEYGNCIRMRKCRKYITGRCLRNFPRNIWRERKNSGQLLCGRIPVHIG